MLVIPLLEIAGEALAAELPVDRLDSRQDAREQGFDVEAADQARGRDGVERGRGPGVCGVDADSDDALVGSLGVAAGGEDAADFDVRGV